MSDSGASDHGFSDADEGHDLLPNGSGDENDSDDEAPAPTGTEPAISETAKLFLLYNRQFHVAHKAVDSGIGHIRCYYRPVMVPNGNVLGAMVSGADGWPKGSALTKTMVSADKIVVLNGKFKEEDEDLATVWYLLIDVEGANNKQDHQILRHMPRSVYKEVLDSIKKNPEMSQSSLLQLQATNENAKALNPVASGFLKVTGEAVPKSGCIMPDKPKGESKRESKKDGKKGDGEAANSGDKRPAVEEPADKQPDSKKPKPSVSSFWKPKTSADKGVAEKASAEKTSADKGVADKGSAPPAKSAGEKPKGPSNEGNVDPPKKDSVSVSSQAPKRARNEDHDQKRIVRKRLESVESHEFVICDGELKSLDFAIPAGATFGKATITWSFA